MSGFISGADRSQGTMFPAQLEDYVAEDNPVRVIDFFVDQLDLRELGCAVDPRETGRPAYHAAVMLKIYVYGYLNRVQSSRRLERECQRNVEAMWLTGCLAPDFKTIADFRKDNGPAIRKVCREFIVVCGRAGLLTAAAVAIEGSKFKAVNSREWVCSRLAVVAADHTPRMKPPIRAIIPIMKAQLPTSPPPPQASALRQRSRAVDPSPPLEEPDHKNRHRVVCGRLGADGADRTVPFSPSEPSVCAKPSKTQLLASQNSFLKLRSFAKE